MVSKYNRLVTVIFSYNKLYSFFILIIFVEMDYIDFAYP